MDELVESDEEGGTARTAQPLPPPTNDAIFPVNAPPPSKRKGKQPAKDPKRSKSTNATPPTTSTSSFVENPCAIERAPRADAQTNDLLDDAETADLDENYSQNEIALSNFLKLHPMLSLDATSQRLMQQVAKMVGDASIPSKELEVVDKIHDDKYLREAKGDERACCLGEKCVCRWLGIFRFGEESSRPFVCREYLLPSQEREFVRCGDLPKTVQKCLLCSRYFTSYLYTLARNSPTFKLTAPVQLQVFQNKVALDKAADAMPSSSSEIGTESGYHASKMLCVDEKWCDTASSRSELSTLLWKPVVRFNSSDYKFVEDSDGLKRVLQIGMNVESQDFGSPLCSSGPSTEAAA